MVTLMIASALTVDLGMLAATNRKLQGVADLAAIAGAVPLTGDACNRPRTVQNPRTLIEQVNDAAMASAARNGFSGVAPKTLVVEVGVLQYDSNGAPKFQRTHSSLTGPDCMVSSVPAAVRVTAGDYTKYAFGPVIGIAGRYSERSAVAGRKQATPGNRATGAFMIGSSVATLDSTNAPILTSVLNGMVCRGVSGCSFNTTLVGYQGLASAGVTLGQLAQARAGLVSVRELLDTDLTVGDLYLASAKALGCTSTVGCSNTAAVTLLGLAASVTSTAKFKLSSLITVVAGSESAAADSTFNVFGLVQGSAKAINGTNAVSIPTANFSIPGSVGPAGSTTVSVTVTELPKEYIGPVDVPCTVVPPPIGSTAPPKVFGSCALTSQVDVTVNQGLNLVDLPVVGGLGVGSLTGNLPITTTAGKAMGTLTQVNCAPKGEVVSVDTTGSKVVIGRNDGMYFLNLSIPAVLTTLTAGVNVNGTASAAGVTGSLVDFKYPRDYLPARSTPKTVNGTALNVQGTTINSSTNLAGVSINAAALTTALTGPSGVVTLLDSAVTQPVFKALGVSVANADVWAFDSPNCGPSLSK